MYGRGTCNLQGRASYIKKKSPVDEDKQFWKKWSEVINEMSDTDVLSRDLNNGRTDVGNMLSSLETF